MPQPPHAVGGTEKRAVDPAGVSSPAEPVARSAARTAAPGDAPRRRADATRNRARIVAAAEALFAAEGLDVSMASVAREAEVGKATLSRHFESAEDLVYAVFADRLDLYGDLATAAADADDPWQGFTDFIWQVCEMQARDRGFADLLTLSLPGVAGLDERREVAFRAFMTTITNAKASGQLREDFASEDLIVLLMANAGVVAATASDAPESWRRLVAQMLRGYARPGVELPAMPPAPASADLERAMARRVGNV